MDADAYARALREADMAATARHGGNIIRRWLARGGLNASTRENAAHWAQREAQGVVQYRWDTYHDMRHSTTLPEAAFDWPIYRAAMGGAPVPDLTCATCGHAFAQHQTGDGPWTGFCGAIDYPEDPDQDDEHCACERPVAVR